MPGREGETVVTGVTGAGTKPTTATTTTGTATGTDTPTPPPAGTPTTGGPSGERWVTEPGAPARSYEASRPYEESPGSPARPGGGAGPVSSAGLGERLAHGFLPERPPVRAMIGTWVRLDELASSVALAPSRDAARDLVERAERAGELAALRARVTRLTHRHAEAAAMRVAVLAAACGWAHLTPTDPEPDERAGAGLTDLWAALGHRLDQPHFVALPALALHNWTTARKPRRHMPIDQLVRAEALVPVVRWTPAGEPLGRLDRFLLATTRLEAHGVWLFRLADALAHTLATQGPDAPATATALRRLARVLHALRAQLLAEQRAVADAPASEQQRTVIAALARAAASPGEHPGRARPNPPRLVAPRSAGPRPVGPRAARDGGRGGGPGQRTPAGHPRTARAPGGRGRARYGGAHG
ncbi:hypothetical protein OYE22_22385 [Streptomyces sp. 71268]|uniref:hypothetical protein n=1 Tax=Streptomyces sp. 71268 TaxID=3002640 RepID=UPI0023F99E13|nr:hypothetical protein [Streptomyces sp. 71268]WEV27624.1 hypothetical protein OYE22_22385 [Streptomyces sp. 71268]